MATRSFRFRGPVDPSVICGKRSWATLTQQSRSVEARPRRTRWSVLLRAAPRILEAPRLEQVGDEQPGHWRIVRAASTGHFVTVCAGARILSETRRTTTFGNGMCSFGNQSAGLCQSLRSSSVYVRRLPPTCSGLSCSSRSRVRSRLRPNEFCGFPRSPACGGLATS
jgi:hypothetical protein